MVVTMMKVQKKRRSTTMATYSQSSFSWGRKGKAVTVVGGNKNAQNPSPRQGRLALPGVLSRRTRGQHQRGPLASPTLELPGSQGCHWGPTHRTAVLLLLQLLCDVRHGLHGGLQVRREGEAVAGTLDELLHVRRKRLQLEPGRGREGAKGKASRQAQQQGCAGGQGRGAALCPWGSVTLAPPLKVTRGMASWQSPACTQAPATRQGWEVLLWALQAEKVSVDPLCEQKPPPDAQSPPSPGQVQPSFGMAAAAFGPSEETLRAQHSLRKGEPSLLSEEQGVGAGDPPESQARPVTAVDAPGERVVPQETCPSPPSELLSFQAAPPPHTHSCARAEVLLRGTDQGLTCWAWERGSRRPACG